MYIHTWVYMYIVYMYMYVIIIIVVCCYKQQSVICKQVTSTQIVKHPINTLCGSVIVIAIANAYTLDEVIDRLSLKFL